MAATLLLVLNRSIRKGPNVVQRGDARPDAVTLGIVRCLAEGLTTAEAAVACSVSEATAWRRLQVLRRDWGVERNIQVVVRAVRQGLI